MQKYKQLIISSLIAVSVIALPTVSFAKDNSHGNKNSEHGNKTETAQLKKDQDSSSRSSPIWNGIWNGVSGLFGNHVEAATTVDTREIASKSLLPNISGITAPTVLKLGEVGTWTVKASDPQNRSLNYAVDWGDTALQPFTTLARTAYVQTSTFTHAYANPGTYTITFTVTNDSGLKAVSTVTVHIIIGQEVTLPVIDNLVATSSTPHNAQITWTTNVPANSFVWYSTTEPVDASGTANIVHRGKILNHKIELNNLQVGTAYYVIVESANNAGTSEPAKTYFITPKLVNNSIPVITSLTGSTTIMAGQTETVTVNAYDPHNDSLTYSVDWGDTINPIRALVFREPAFMQTSTFTHIYVNPGIYTATFTAENSTGLKTSSSIVITATSSE